MSIEQALKTLKSAKTGSTNTASLIPLSVQPKLQLRMLTALLLNWNGMHSYTQYVMREVLLPFAEATEAKHVSAAFPAFYSQVRSQSGNGWNPLATVTAHFKDSAYKKAMPPFMFHYCMVCNSVTALKHADWNCLIATCRHCAMPPSMDLQRAAMEVNQILLAHKELAACANQQLSWLYNDYWCNHD